MKGYTLSKAAAVLQRAGYPITERQLRDWIDKEVLPHPTDHGRGQGKGKVYTWSDRTIIKQAAMVWELLCWYGRMRPLPFMLWLLGFELPLSVVRQQVLQWVDGGIEQVLEGVDLQDAEQIADRLSALAVQAHQRQRRQASIHERAAQEELLELYLNIRFNPFYTPSETALRQMLQELSSTQQFHTRRGETVPPEPPLEVAQAILQFLQQHLSQQCVAQAVSAASDAQLQQAREDFGRMLQMLDKLVAHRLHPQEYWQEFKYTLVGNLGRFVIPFMLTLRREGYGHWLEKVMEWVDAFETFWRTDPLFRHAVQQGDLVTAITRWSLFADAEDDLWA